MKIPEELDDIVVLDFEFGIEPGGHPKVRCGVFESLGRGESERVWLDGVGVIPTAPTLSVGRVAYVGYFTPAEWSCYLTLGWPLPEFVIDLFAEFRVATNGLALSAGRGLLGALSYFGLPHMESALKDEMRMLALRGGPYSEEEKEQLLAYCAEDVGSTARLAKVMLPQIPLRQALLRGRYMKAVAEMEHVGLPVDVDALTALRRHWLVIQKQLIQAVSGENGIYEGRTFKQARFAAWLASQSIEWPRLPSGRLDLRDSTFKEMAAKDERVRPLRELRSTLGQMRLNELPVGPDRRNRTMLSPYRSKTGRNQPSNSRFLFGPAAWMRSLLKPEQGRAIAYVDWEQQEFGIAAALSGDTAMQEAYHSGDPYLEFAKQAGRVPPEGTKQSHPRERDLFKQCVLAVQYGMGAEALAARIGTIPAEARELLRLHRYIYRRFWAWIENEVSKTLVRRSMRTGYGWTLHLDANPNLRSISNFPMQANGAEMMRVAAILATEAGLKVCAPIHDAFLIEAGAVEIEEVSVKMQSLMQEASRHVLSGFELRSDCKITRYPDRYVDPRGEKMWDLVMQIVEGLETATERDVAPQQQADPGGVAPTHH